MRLSLTLFLSLLVELSDAQYGIRGRIVDSETKEPLEGVSVFLSNTTKGSATNKKGEFLLDDLKSGRYELVITAVNYEDYILPVQINETTESVTIKLIRKATVLKEVVVESYDRDGWDKWGDSFKFYLVGSSKLSGNCILRNPEVVKFQYSNKANRLRAFSNERLIFDNTDLGYRIFYLLSKFEIDFNDGTFSFKGYPVFEELKSKKKWETARWLKMRSEIYRGSLRHFIRSLYFDQLSKNGFEVREVRYVSSGEASRVKSLLKTMHGEGKDSMEYYLKVKNLPVEDSTVTLDHIIPRDSILAKSTDRNSKSLSFRGHLQIRYVNKRIPTEFASTLPAYRRSEFIQSEISLNSDNPIALYPNGNYYNGLNLLIVGYWAWSEKISTMLPTDYVDSR